MKKHIHFIGIGGIGVSALAQYYLSLGFKVSGSDLNSSEITELLKKKGAEIFIGPHFEKNIKEPIDMVIYSPAVKKNNPELKKAKEIQRRNSHLKILSYPQALGELTKKYFTIAISGTHGKSTTTAMTSLILEKAGFDPTVIIGTKLKEFDNSNFRLGKSKYLIIEADEWQASFLNYWPQIIVITNIEKEHLDYYKNLKQILETYKKYIKHLPKNGFLIINKDDKNIKKIISEFKDYIFFIKEVSIKDKEAEKIEEILKVPGKHNVFNALCALSVARILNISDEISFKALSKYKGAWRRFEEKKIKINKKNINVIFDYAHHPTEINATLKATREKFKNKRIVCIFQPHQYQRTYYLFNDFVKVFKEAKIDKIIITDIYDVAGREKINIKEKINSEKLVKKINKKTVIYLPKNKILNYLEKNLNKNDILIIMGAGDIYQFFNKSIL
ncbi:MAG TPA: UDP-N-acetylmuramate--L-alanine ligase [Candidatus Pacearchaeota archaeon]|nr:UDP-N-acetylmuramate--L-alanine ligase [Candidatus Pacearchaeota archaeon]